jgi:hypothetical protein
LICNKKVCGEILATDQDPSITRTPLFKKFSFSDTILLAIFPIIGYSVLFVYEWGYFRVFRLPLQFINFDIGEIFVVTSYLITLLVIVSIFVNLIFKPFFSKKIHPALKIHIGIAIPIYAVFIALLVIYFGEWKEFLMYLIGMIFFTINLFLPPLLNRKVKGSYEDKFVALEEQKQKQHTKDSEKSLVDLVIGKLSPEIFLAVLIYAAVLFVAYNAGRGAALTQNEFRVVNTNPESVVLYTKADGVIVSPFDRNNKEIQPIYKYISFENEAVEFKLEEVGPLRFKSEAISPIPSSTLTPTMQSTQILIETPPNSLSPSQLAQPTKPNVPEP